jgi:2-polyprenyl-3-methyl-5-hydroxy-6-metoxy-1,4-benzoquinol methylase
VILSIIDAQFFHKSVIDFGCGRGALLNEAYKHGALEVVGSERE